MSKRVLVIAYFYPPLANSGTQRPLKFTRYLRDFGWEPHVLSIADPPDLAVDPTLLAEVPPGMAVTRVAMANDAAARRAAPLIGRRLAEGLAWRARGVFGMPDIYALWRRPAVKAGLRIHRSSPFHAIFATGFPWTALLAGRDLSAATGQPLIADFRDPWMGDDIFRESSHSTREWQLERSVVNQASAVLTVSEVMTQQMRGYHDAVAADRFLTIPNGFDPHDFRDRDHYPAPPPGKFRIVYTGVWKGNYGPSVLYDAVAHLKARRDPQLERLEIVVAGFAPGQAQERGLSSYIQELGVLPHRGALGLAATADLLFAAIAPGSYQKLALPGKMFEYLAAGKQIVATADPDGEVAMLLRRVGGGIVIPPVPETVADTLVRAVASGLGASPVNHDALARYQRRNLTGELARVLERVSASQNPARS